VPSEVNGYRFKPLIDNPQDILPQQTISIPVEITKITESEEEESLSRKEGDFSRKEDRGTSKEDGLILDTPHSKTNLVPRSSLLAPQKTMEAPLRDPGVSIACGIGQMAKFFDKC
jgi:hypothetical protein